MSDINEANKELSEIKRKTSESERANNQIKASIEDKKKLEKELDEKIKDKEAKLDLVGKEIEKQEFKLGKTLADYKDADADLHDKLVALKEAIADAEYKAKEDNKKFIADKESREQKIQELKDTYENIMDNQKEDVEQMKLKIDVYKEKEVRARERKVQTDRLLAEVVDLNTKAKEKTKEINANISDLNATEKNLKNSVDAVNYSLEGLKEMIVTSEGEATKLKEDIEVLNETKENSQKNLDEINAKLEEMTRYRINLIKKGQLVNRVMEDIKELYKKANIAIPISVEPIEVPKE